MRVGVHIVVGCVDGVTFAGRVDVVGCVDGVTFAGRVDGLSFLSSF